MNEALEEINQRVEEASVFVERLLGEIGKVIVGQKYLLERILIGLFAPGHILIEGVPGLAKTLSASTASACIKVKFRRIQFTPDLLPADLIGTMIYDQKEQKFQPKQGPIFANLILADEINRAPAKVQSALLEAMQEGQVTLGDTTYPLKEPFLVLATQNPIEQEGTYPLPEAQVDRFMLKLKLDYPTKEEERQILERMTGSDKIIVKPVLTPKEILSAREVVQAIYMDNRIKEYILDLVFATRYPTRYRIALEDLIEFGASPRATIFLTRAAKAHAFLQGRGYVTPEDVKAIGYDVLRHRLILTYEAEAEQITSEDIIRQVFDEIEVP